MSTSILLSICIPTYNGGENLKTTIDCILKSIGTRDDIEVIVSDNCSNEETKRIIESYTNRGLIKANYNSQNLGFNGNLMMLLEHCAQGEYCWVLGDDDFIDVDTFELIYPLLCESKYDYISINSKFITQQQYNNLQSPQGRELDYIEGDFFTCLDSNASVGNVLGTFMSSHIFRLGSIFKVGIKEVYRSNAWDNYLNVFPNSNLMLDAFHGSNKCVAVRPPLISTLIREKTYSNKMGFLVNTIIPELYKHYVKVAGSAKRLSNNKKAINQLVYWSNFKRFVKGDFKNVIFSHLFNPQTIVAVYNGVKHHL